MRTDLIAIAAMSENRVIGFKNQLPWNRIPGDLPRFKRLTDGHVVVMGRKTFESMGSKPLPNRTNFIMSRTADQRTTNTFHDVETLLKTLAAFNRRPAFVIGGAQVYQELLPYCSDFYLTLVRGNYDGDTFMPPFEEQFAGYVVEESHDHSEFRHYVKDAPKNFVRTGSHQEHVQV